MTTAGTFNVDYIAGTWVEKTVTANLHPALGAAITTSGTLTTASKNQYILINVTSAVQAWLNGSQANDGLALVANSTFNASFDSKENATTSHPARTGHCVRGRGRQRNHRHHHGQRQRAAGRRNERHVEAESDHNLRLGSVFGLERLRLGLQNAGRRRWLRDQRSSERAILRLSR